MARLYYDAGGFLVRHLKMPQELRKYPSAPPGTAGFLAYDPAVNAAVAKLIDGEWNTTHRVVAGVLQRNGVPVVFAPPAPRGKYADRQQLASLDGKLDAGPVVTLDQADLKLIGRLVRRLMKERSD